MFPAFCEALAPPGIIAILLLPPVFPKQQFIVYVLCYFYFYFYFYLFIFTFFVLHYFCCYILYFFFCVCVCVCVCVCERTQTTYTQPKNKNRIKKNRIKKNLTQAEANITKIATPTIHFISTISLLFVLSLL